MFSICIATKKTSEWLENETAVREQEENILHKTSRDHSDYCPFTDRYFKMFPPASLKQLIVATLNIAGLSHILERKTH